MKGAVAKANLERQHDAICEIEKSCKTGQEHRFVVPIIRIPGPELSRPFVEKASGIFLAVLVRLEETLLQTCLCRGLKPELPTSGKAHTFNKMCQFFIEYKPQKV